MATIEPAPRVPSGSEVEPSSQPTAAPDASGVAEGSAAVGAETEMSVDAAPELVQASARTEGDSDVSGWIKGSFAREGLAFMLDHPVAAIWKQVYTLIGVLLGGFFFVLIILFILLQGLSSAFGQVLPLTDNAFKEVFIICLCMAVFIVVACAVSMIVPAVQSTLREWSRVGNRMALMLGFVALFFLSADSWRLLGAVPWWRLRTFVVVFALVYIRVLYRQAKRIVNDVVKQPIKADDVPSSVKKEHPLIGQALNDIVSLDTTGAGIPKRSLFNLCAVAVILLARRIIISGIIVSTVLFMFGIILLGEQDTLGLMGGPSLAVIGFTATFGIRGYQFFLSESLLKVSLSLGAIAAAYFVFANPDPDPDPDRDRDTLVITFIRKAIALWACYQHLTEAVQPERPVAEGIERADSEAAEGASPD
jgi:hypothetical protein